jgi:peptidylprolyl isomerase
MRQSVVTLTLLITAVWMAAQTKSAPTPPAKAAPAMRPTPVPTPAAKPSKVSGKPHTTPSGVEYWDVKMGKGAVATKGKMVTFTYTGWLANGKEFDSRDDLEEALQVTLGDGKLIKGWDEGITGMKVGGKRQLHIPASAAYGAKGAPPIIPPNSALILDVVLVAVK